MKPVKSKNELEVGQEVRVTLDGTIIQLTPKRIIFRSKGQAIQLTESDQAKFWILRDAPKFDIPIPTAPEEEMTDLPKPADL